MLLSNSHSFLVIVSSLLLPVFPFLLSFFLLLASSHRSSSSSSCSSCNSRSSWRMLGGDRSTDLVQALYFFFILWVILFFFSTTHTVELKVEMVAIHEKRLRKCLSKIKGIEKIEVEVSNQKAVITGYVHKNKILKTVRRSGLKADFWSAQNEILLNAYASGKYGRFRFNNFSFFF